MPSLNVVEPRSAFNGEPSPQPPGKALRVSWPQAARSAAIGLDKNRSRDSTTSPAQQEAQQVYAKKARRKAISRALALALSRVAKHPNMRRAYLRTAYECCNTVKQEDGTLVTKYCKHRWCVTCSSVRTAQLIEKYRPELSTWASPVFLTLTVKSCGAAQLRPLLKNMSKTFRLAVQQARRKHPGSTVKLVRSLEVTYNPEKGFHPHFHVLVENMEVAKTLVSYWVSRREDASHMGQDLRPANSGSLLELFKYAVKVGIGKGEIAPAWALNEMMEALWQMKCVLPYGIKFDKVPDEDDFDIKATVEAFKEVDADVIFWDWEQQVRDWFCKYTGEILSEYEPSPKMEDFITKIEKLRE